MFLQNKVTAKELKDATPGGLKKVVSKTGLKIKADLNKARSPNELEAAATALKHAVESKKIDKEEFRTLAAMVISKDSKNTHSKSEGKDQKKVDSTEDSK